jgi:Ca2+-transporting ATPase
MQMDKQSLQIGLTASEAKNRLAQDGPNELSLEKTRGLLKICAEVVAEPMFLLLLAAGGIYLLMGDLHDALVLLAFVSIIIGVTIAQEQRTERALEALRDLSSPRALVVRDGCETRIAGRDVVVGDILLLAEGDRVPADARILEFHELSADESMLTGESVSVPKLSTESFVYAGTMIVCGQGVAEVIAIGKATRLGSIGSALQEIDPEASPLHRQVKRLTTRIALIAIALSVGLVLIYACKTGDWFESILSGITLAMAALPQEFPVIMIVFFALGARRIAQHRVLTRNLNAIETLGKTTVLCVDKTGTLTENRMTVAALAVNGVTLSAEGLTQLPAAYVELVRYTLLASEIEPHDPMEQAFHTFAQKHLALSALPGPDWHLTREYELSPELMAMSHVWHGADMSEQVIASKGAPEAIMDLCHLSAVRCQQIEAEAKALAEQGLRVLGVARASYPVGDAWPDIQHDFDFEFVGLIGLEDPVRADVPAAVAACQRAGIRVVMITGDHPRTAAAIAHKVGIAADDVYARITPERKLEIVNRLKAQGEIVAMTGDGVNDAPALKAAHIGIAMGKRGTDVAREAASLVLMEDDFGAIVSAIALGRRIFGNLRQALLYTLTIHIPVICLSILPVLLGLPLLLLPIHIAFLELVFDPTCSLVFEAERGTDAEMAQPPRRATEPLLTASQLVTHILLGLVMGGLFTVIYARLYADATALAEVRALVFTMLVAATIGFVIALRQPRLQLRRLFSGWPRLSVAVIGVTLCCLLAIAGVAPLANLFSMTTLPLWLVGLLLLLTISVVLVATRLLQPLHQEVAQTTSPSMLP